MEPFSALTIACAVVQFVEFGCGIISKIPQIYQSNSALPATETSEIAQIKQDLEALHDEVLSKSKLTATSSEEIFMRHCQTCVEIGKELQSCVDEASVVRANRLNRVLSSARLALRQREIKKKLETIRSRLERVQSQMATAALVHMWRMTKEQNKVVESSNLSSYVAILNSLSDSQQSGEQGDSSGSGKQDHTQTPVSQNVMLDAMWTMIKLDPTSFEGYYPQFAPGVPSIQNKTHDLCRRFIAHHLSYEQLGYREGSIPKAHAKTFEWVFAPPQTDALGEPKWSSFSDWLQGADCRSVYWITGKPGAGKSTLLKFILQDARTKDLLKNWSGDRPLLVLDFYFWAAGGELQRSREGLLRTMLFQALGREPNLVPLVFPKPWTLAMLFGEESLNHIRLSFEDLLDAFRAMLGHFTTKGNVALFVDGLDEFQGDHRVLVELVRRMADTPNLKICVSSRPWNEFRDEFSRGPNLKVELLTRSDIDHYVKDHFNKSEGFREVSVLNGPGAAKLINDIVDKAQGVFLWVRIVIRSLLTGLSDGNNLQQLQDEVDRTPKELGQVFNLIWLALSPQHQTEARRYFLMLRVTNKMGISLNALSLWFSDDSYSIHTRRAAICDVDAGIAIQALTRRLSSRSKGLIEIQVSSSGSALRPEDYVVGYMHRSAMDWVDSQDWMNSQASLPGVHSSSTAECAPFDPFLYLLKGETLRLAKCETVTEFYGGEHNIADNFEELIIRLFNNASRVVDDLATLETFISVLDRVDQELTRLAGIQPTKYGRNNGYTFFGYFWITDTAPHWSNILAIDRAQLYQRNNDRAQLRDHDMVMVTDFLSFLSQIPIVPYVRVKVLNNPSLLSQQFDGRFTGPITAAIECHLSPGYGRMSRWGNMLDLDIKRAELLRFFLRTHPVKVRLLRKRVRKAESQTEKSIFMFHDGGERWYTLVYEILDTFKQPNLVDRVFKLSKGRGKGLDGDIYARPCALSSL